MSRTRSCMLAGSFVFEQSALRRHGVGGRPVQPVGAPEVGASGVPAVDVVDPHVVLRVVDVVRRGHHEPGARRSAPVCARNRSGRWSRRARTRSPRKVPPFGVDHGASSRATLCLDLPRPADPIDPSTSVWPSGRQTARTCTSLLGPSRTAACAPRDTRDAPRTLRTSPPAGLPRTTDRTGPVDRTSRVDRLDPVTHGGTGAHRVGGAQATAAATAAQQHRTGTLDAPHPLREPTPTVRTRHRDPPLSPRA